MPGCVCVWVFQLKTAAFGERQEVSESFVLCGVVCAHHSPVTLGLLSEILSTSTFEFFVWLLSLLTMMMVMMAMVLAVVCTLTLSVSEVEQV